jgi:hypothetical protein
MPRGLLATDNLHRRPVYLWLDDCRPAPDGWVGVTTVVGAKRSLETGRVDRASLDHDLGACERCMDGMDVNQWLEAHSFRTMPHCTHVGTGYDLCVWMAKTGHWPTEMPTVHSANRVGRRRMKAVIAKYFPRHR